MNTSANTDTILLAAAVLVAAMVVGLVFNVIVKVAVLFFNEWELRRPRNQVDRKHDHDTCQRELFNGQFHGQADYDRVWQPF